MINFRAVIRSNTTQFAIATSTVLVSTLLLTVASSTRAASSINTDTTVNNAFENSDNYCLNNIEAKTYHTKYQSARRRAIDCMQTQLRAYQTIQSTTRQQYFAYKAQAWLNYAAHEDSIKSYTLAGTQALQAGATILKALQQTDEDLLSLTTDIPSTSALMRPDLWAIISALKDTGGIDSAPRELAFSEVSLVWAAADHCEHGARQSGSHFRMADRWLEQAREAYVNAHDSATNVALEALTDSYYKQYAPLDPSDDVCRGHTFLSDSQDTSNIQGVVEDNALDNTATLNINIDRQVAFAEVITAPNPTATYSIVQ